MSGSDSNIPVLQQLVESCQSGERAFRQAARIAKDTELKGLFKACAHQHRRFAIELTAHSKNPSLTLWHSQPFAADSLPPAETAPCCSALAELDPDWAEGTALQHCLAGAHGALEIYEQALASPLPQHTRFLVEAQFSLLKKTRDRMCMLQVHSSNNPLAHSTTATQLKEEL